MLMRVTMIFSWTKKNNQFYDNQKKPCTAGFFYIRVDQPANIPNRMILFLAAAMVSGSLFAQQQVTGLVMDSSTSEPIEGVNITAEKSGTGTSTNSSGRFSLEITASDSVLIFEHIAFDRSVVPFSDTAGELRIGLEPKIIPLKKLDVLGDTGRGQFSQLETKNMVTDIRVNEISIRGYSDIGDVLLNEESVFVSESPTGAKTISIRGARQEEMVYMYDGVRMDNGGRQSLDLSMFDIGGLETVEVLRGGHDHALGSSGTINLVPELAYRTRLKLYQRFGTYNTGSYHTGFSLGKRALSLDFGTGKGSSRQYYASADDADILKDFSNRFISAGYRPFSETELKFYQVASGRAYRNHYTGDSIGSSLRMSTLKLEHNSKTRGELELYLSSQQTAGEDDISRLQTERDDTHTVTGVNYRLPIDNGYLELFMDRALKAAEWTTSGGDISLERDQLSLSGAFGLSQGKTRKGFEIKDFVVNINSNIVEDRTNNKSSLLNNRSSWKLAGATAAVSAWDHLDNTIVYLFSNIGSSFRVPSIAERYAHALRPEAFMGDTLLTEYKIMQEIGFKLSSRDPGASPAFSGSISHFNYLYTNKIKTIQYSGTPLQFPVNYGSAEISGIELKMEVFTFHKRLGFSSVYSLYNFSDQLTFSLQPAEIGRHNIILSLGPVTARVGLKNEGSRVMTTVDKNGSLTNNYLQEHRSLDVHISCRIRFTDFAASVGIFGQNLNDDSQTLEGVSVYDKRVYLSVGLEWN